MGKSYRSDNQYSKKWLNNKSHKSQKKHQTPSKNQYRELDKHNIEHYPTNIDQSQDE